MPKKQRFQVQLIYNSQEDPVPYALPGEIVKMKVKNITEANVSRGCMICDNDKCQVCYEFEATLKISDLPDGVPLLSSGYNCILHLHTAMEEITISKIKGNY